MKKTQGLQKILFILNYLSMLFISGFYTLNLHQGI